MSEPAAELVERLAAAKRVTVLSGAGISAESGVPTFRDAQQGYWARFRPEQLATPEAFERDPELVWNWYDMRRRLVASVDPNPAHHALAHWADFNPGLSIVTQNVDGLHQRAGSADVTEIHGNIMRDRCHREHRILEPVEQEPGIPPTCKHCGGPVRPDVVWFGEEIPLAALEHATEAANACEVFLSVGTSALVHPAAGLAEAALQAGALLVEINPQHTPLSALAHYHLEEPAGSALPRLVDLLEARSCPLH